MIINNHKNFRDRLSIDYQYQSINWYRLSSIVIDCHWLSISLIVQVLFLLTLLTITGITGTGIAFFDSRFLSCWQCSVQLSVLFHLVSWLMRFTFAQIAKTEMERFWRHLQSTTQQTIFDVKHLRCNFAVRFLRRLCSRLDVLQHTQNAHDLWLKSLIRWNACSLIRSHHQARDG